ncbi:MULTISPECIES: tetratricopeptide repeat protein [unclassified Streptomyces]|uniref:tetratricopeptide repeat protein n=1 Tax=unclassified Streptomyces TaxID=2593676 RepID=UPI00136BB46A|nr:tetratricopeptide repeat protein [Streptomyces sp. SID335]MYZ14888.1 tetratricopeptide repeat protein [Streptomyces sp. SID337]NDZ85450.1 tetratricopeptide repeat protein [Streptomyces sp. SID10115]NEA02640.1 tetratricopeptide repeat protein [Streptomyces sp. SID10116]NEB44780.1 tetratricopeptide repeat protein [Streptomyces sp. SID339]
MAAPKGPNSRLRDVIETIGCTYEALAKDIRRIAAENGEILQTNKSAVSHWANGARRPTGRTGQYLAEALSRRTGRPITLVEIGLREPETAVAQEADPVLSATDLGRADVERRRFLAVAAFTTAGVAMPLLYDHEATARMLRARTGSSLVGIEDVDVVRQITAAFSAADERLGGGHGLTTVTAYLADTAAPMLRGRFPNEALRQAAFGAVAELTYLAGWKHHDLGQEGAAQRYYQVGYQLACEADPRGHAAWMMRALAHQALSLKQPHHCVDLVEGALTRGLGHVDGQTEALLHITHARAYAAVGAKPAAARALLAAEDALLRDDGPQPSYSRVSGPASGTVASHTARTLTDLADHVGTEQQHRDALVRWDPEKYKRVHALTHADLGDSLAAQARADEAVAAWSQALTLMEGMTSDRTRKAITSLRSTLSIYQRRKVPGAAELARRAREALA